MKQNQAHGKPNRANPPTDSQKKKKKKKTQNQKSNLPTLPTVTSLQRLQRKSIPNILRKSTDYNLQSKIKTYQKQYTVFIKKKTKKNPNTDFVPKWQNQTKTPIVIVAIARPSSQSQIAISPLIEDRSAQIRTFGA